MCRNCPIYYHLVPNSLFLIFIDPLGQPSVKKNSDHYFHIHTVQTFVRPFQNSSKAQHIQVTVLLARLWPGRVDH